MKTIHWIDHCPFPEAAFVARLASIPYRRPFPYHGHDFPELFWSIDGAGTHDLNGKSDRLAIGDMVFMRPGDCHGFRPAKGSELVQYNIVIAPRKLEELGQRYFRKNRIFFWEQGPHPHQVRLTKPQMKRMNAAADGLRRGPSDDYYLDRFLLNLFDELFDEPTAELPEEAPEWLANACRRANRPEVFSRGCQGFIELAGRSAEHVSREFHRHMGRTLTDYLTELRLEHASRELVSGNTPIVDIAQDCGYSNLSHFYKLFTEKYGLPPRRYRMNRWLYPG